MIRQINLMYPFWACIIGIITAQLIKPVFYYWHSKKWDLSKIHASGGYPSSHSAGVIALTLAVGIQDSFYSTNFAIALAFSLIVIYDAANVRWYAGQNIQLTKQLIEDIQTLTSIKLDDPIYGVKVKAVLGHKWTEVLGGIIHGIIIALLMLLIM